MKHGKEVASCISHVRLPQMMLATVQKACGAENKEWQAEWKQDGTCPTENLLGSCATGDDNAYGLETYWYKWSDAKIDTAAGAKATCAAGKWKAP